MSQESSWASLLAQMVKNPPANAGDISRHGFDPWVWKIPWRRKWQPTPVFLSGESHGQRSLVGYSPWGWKELDTTERFNTHTHSNRENRLWGQRAWIWTPVLSGSQFPWLWKKIEKPPHKVLMGIKWSHVASVAPMWYLLDLTPKEKSFSYPLLDTRLFSVVTYVKQKQNKKTAVIIIFLIFFFGLEKNLI